MKKKNNNIIIIFILYAIFYIFSVILAGIFNNFFIVILSAVLIVTINQLIYLKERKKLNKVLNDYLDHNQYQQIIDYLNNKKISVITLKAYNYCLVNLAICYMYTDQILYAGKILEMKRFKNNKSLMYSKFLIAVAKNNNDGIEYYQNIILNKLPAFYNKQKESVTKIINMIQNNQMDETIYEETKYPILKKICERISGINVYIELPENSSDIYYKNNYSKISNFKKTFKKTLNLLTIFSFAITLFIIIIIDLTKPITHFEQIYYLLKNLTWFYLFVPITIFNIIYGIYLKKQHTFYKANLVLGIVFTAISLFLGTLNFVQYSIFSQDRQVAYTVEQKLKIDVADDFDILISDLNIQPTLLEEGNYLSKEIIIRNNSRYKYNENHWKDGFDSINNLPLMALSQVADYDKFFIYCEADDIFNPKEIEFNKYYYLVAYDKKNHNYVIYEFINVK